MRKILQIIILIILPLSIFAQADQPNAYKGVVDLREWNFKKQENIKLSGEWEFYWNKLYTPKDFINQVHIPDAYIIVPGTWNNIKIQGKNIPDTGFATLRLVLFVNDSTRNNISIFIPEILSSYKLWFNNNLVTQVGKVGNSDRNTIPGLHFTINSLDITGERNQIIIQISNFSHRSNCFDQSPYIGNTEKIVRLFSWKLAYDFIFFGLALIMAFYHIGIFILRRKNIAALSFALLAIVLAVRMLFTDSYPIQFLIPSISWKATYIIAYATFFLLFPAFTFFMQQTFEEKKYKWIFRSIYIISFIFLFTLLLPSLTYSKLLIYYQIIVIFAILFFIFLLFKYLKEKRNGAILLSITFLLVFATGINDVLYYQDIIKTTTLLPFGVFILILGQSLTLARIFTKAFSDNEHLTAKLDYQNLHLQDLVDERTKKIELQNQDILQKNEELQVQKEELQTQTDEITRQKDLLSTHNKLITASINYASSIQNAILPTGKKIKKYFDNFVLFLPKDIVSGDFYWFTETNPKYLFLSVGDCTGHGVPGAFLSLISMYLLNSVVIEKSIEDPKEIIKKLEDLFNNFLHKVDNNSHDGMDLAILRFEKQNLKKLTFAAAKTNIYVFDPKEQKITRYKGSRRSIGYVSYSNFYNNIEFKNKEIDLPKNYTIYCSSDGIVDQNNKERKRFGTQRLIRTLEQIANLPILQQKIRILKELQDFQQDEVQRDDISIIAIKQKK